MAKPRLIATMSQVNVAEQRLKDTQSQGDDSPATPLRLTSSSAAINRGELLIRSPLTLPPCRGIEGVLHATRCTEGCGDSREDGDYYIEDLAPESVVVECSHSEIIG